MNAAGFVASAAKESLRRAGTPMVAHTRAGKVLAVVCMVFFGGAAGGAAVFAPPAEAAFYAAGFGGFFLLGLVLAVETFYSQVTYDDTCIHARSLWRGRRTIPWEAVERCDYGEYNQWYRVHTGRHGILRLSIMMWGLADFLKRLPCPHPAYPPVNTLGETVYGGRLPVDWPESLTAPGFPVPMKLRSATVIALGFAGVGCGLIGFSALAPAPTEKDYLRVEGKLTEVKRVEVDRRHFVLQLGLDQAPAPLKASSKLWGSKGLEAFQKAGQVGDLVTVTVPEGQWRDPCQVWMTGERKIWLAGLEREGRTYLSFARHMRRQRAEHRWLPWSGLFLVGMGGAVQWQVRRRRRQFAAAAQSPTPAAA